MDQLRLLKLQGDRVPAATEIVFIKPEEQSGGPCPVIYLSTDAARMLREVRHIGTGKTELIGAMYEELPAPKPKKRRQALQEREK